MRKLMRKLSALLGEEYSEKSSSFIYKISGIAGALDYKTEGVSIWMIIIIWSYFTFVTYLLTSAYTIFSGDSHLTMFEVIDVLTGVVPAFTAILMMCCIFYRLNGIQNLNQLFDTRLLSFGTIDDREIVRKNIKKSNMFIFIYFGPVYSNLVFWLIRPLLSNDKNIFNTINNGTEIIYKIVDCHYPFDYKVTPTYYFVCFYEIFGVYQIVTLMLVSDSLFGSMVLVFCGQLEVLKFNIDKLKVNEVQLHYDEHGVFKITMEKNLKSIIKNHQKLISIFQEMKNVFQPMIVVRMGGCCFSVCMMLFKVSKASSFNASQIIRDAAYLITNAIEMLMYPWFGNRLKQISLDLNKELYETDWRQASSKYRRAVTLMMVRVQRPLCFSFMGIMDLDLVAFEYAVKFCYTYYTMLHLMSISTASTPK